jgi:hypothetical protein
MLMWLWAECCRLIQAAAGALVVERELQRGELSVVCSYSVVCSHIT